MGFRLMTVLAAYHDLRRPGQAPPDLPNSGPSAPLEPAVPVSLPTTAGWEGRVLSQVFSKSYFLPCCARGNRVFGLVMAVENPNSFLQTLDNTKFRKMPLSVPGHLDDFPFSDLCFQCGIGYAWLSPSIVTVPFKFPDIEMDVTSIFAFLVVRRCVRRLFTPMGANVHCAECSTAVCGTASHGLKDGHSYQPSSVSRSFRRLAQFIVLDYTRPDWC